MVLVKSAARVRAACAIALLLSVLVIDSVRPAHAVAFIVNDAGDAIDAAPGNGVCATAGATCTLRAAIMEANALAGADSITFASSLGTITLFSPLPQIFQALTITGRGAGTTIIDGSSAFRAFDVVAGTIVTISSLTVQHALAAIGPALTNQGTVTLNSVTFTLNSASSPAIAGTGGAINNGPPGTLTITGSTISNNTAVPLILVVAAGSLGGGILNNGTLTMTLSHVTGNSATVGGGVANNGTFTATDSDLAGNNANGVPPIIGSGIGGTGGGITSSIGSLTLNRVTVSGNNAGASGGVAPFNVPGQGGGVMVNGGASSFTDVTVSGNTASDTAAPTLPGAGGGILIVSGTLATLVNVTIASNAAGATRGSNLQGFNASLQNVILSTPLGAGANCSAAPTDAGHNLESTNSCGFVAASDIVNGNANLGALGANGGPTQTRALGAGSQAIDTGDNVGCPAVDQRGVVRPLGAACDIGAYEFAPVPAVTSINPTSGPAAGGTSVVITGTGFTGATAVAFGAAAAASFTVNSDTQVTAVSPAGTGTVDVQVTAPGGTSPAVAADAFRFIPLPVVTGVAPNSGPAAGGTSVVITGTGFLGTAVAFGATPATSFTVNSATQITAVSPAGSGTVDVRVTTAGGTSATVAADTFTFVAAPAPTPSPTPTIGLPATGRAETGGGLPWALPLLLLCLLSLLGLALAWRRS